MKKYLTHSLIVFLFIQNVFVSSGFAYNTEKVCEVIYYFTYTNGVGASRTGAMMSLEVIKRSLEDFLPEILTKKYVQLNNRTDGTIADVIETIGLKIQADTSLTKEQREGNFELAYRFVLGLDSLPKEYVELRNEQYADVFRKVIENNPDLGRHLRWVSAKIEAGNAVVISEGHSEGTAYVTIVGESLPSEYRKSYRAIAVASIMSYELDEVMHVTLDEDPVVAAARAVWAILGLPIPLPSNVTNGGTILDPRNHFHQTYYKTGSNSRILIINIKIGLVYVVESQGSNIALSIHVDASSGVEMVVRSKYSTGKPMTYLPDGNGINFEMTCDEIKEAGTNELIPWVDYTSGSGGSIAVTVEYAGQKLTRTANFLCSQKEEVDYKCYRVRGDACYDPWIWGFIILGSQDGSITIDSYEADGFYAFSLADYNIGMYQQRKTKVRNECWYIEKDKCLREVPWTKGGPAEMCIGCAQTPYSYSFMYWGSQCVMNDGTRWGFGTCEMVYDNPDNERAGRPYCTY